MAEKTGFFDLPPETRNLIYELALGGEVIHVYRKPSRVAQACSSPSKLETRVCSTDCCKQGNVFIAFNLRAQENERTSYYDQHACCLGSATKVSLRDGMAMNLPLVNKQIYDEAALLFFATNTFLLDLDHDCLNHFVQSLSEKQLEAITRIAVFTVSNFRLFSTVTSSTRAALPNLRRLEIAIQVPKTHIMNPKWLLDIVSSKLREFGKPKGKLMRVGVAVQVVGGATKAEETVLGRQAEELRVEILGDGD